MYFSKLIWLDIVEYGIKNGIAKSDVSKYIGHDVFDFNADIKYVEYEDMEKTLTYIGKNIGDDFLGLHIGEQFELKGTEKVNEIMQYSSTLEQAFSHADRYGKLISDALESYIEKNNSHTKIFFSPNPDWALCAEYAVRQVMDMTLVCTHKSIHWLTDKKYSPVEIQLNYPVPKYKNDYYRIFNCPIKFGKLKSCLIYPNTIFGQNLSSDHNLLLELKKAADEAVAELNTEAEIILRIKKLILENLPKRLSVKIAAQELCVSPRTLQRKLTALKTSFKKIEKDILIKMAKKLIVDEKRELDEISYLLGFSETSAFVRFFKKEMQVPPMRYGRKVGSL